MSKYTMPDLKPVIRAVPEGHPFKDKRNHQALLEYAQARLHTGKQVRDSVIDRYRRIDREISGWFEPSETDGRRLEQQKRKGTPTAVEVKLPLVNFYLKDMLSFLMGVFAPGGGIFHYIGKPDTQDAGNALIDKLNKDAQFADYYNQILRSCWTLLKYNIAGFETVWDIQNGPVFLGDDVTPTVQQQEIWAGNRITAIDPYNLLVDPSVRADRLHIDGEFAGYASRISNFEAIRNASTGFFQNMQEAFKRTHFDNVDSRFTYYRHPPTEAMIRPSVNGMDISGGMNWMHFMGMAGTEAFSDRDRTSELVTLYIQLVPKQFGLSKSTALEPWRLLILNDTHIVNAERVTNAHGWLPINLAYGEDDLLESAQKSFAEEIEPFQSYVSYLLNTHIKNTRKKLWGRTFYDARYVDLANVPGDELAAEIPVNPQGETRGIRDFVFTNNDSAQDTRQLLSDVGDTMSLLQNLFPTQALPSQVAGIDRAIESQVAVVLQGAARRNHMLANALDGTLMRPMRLMMYYNLLQFAKPFTVAVPGGRQEISAQQFRNLDENFIIGQGLKSVDKELLQVRVRDLVVAVLQSQTASQEFDVVALMDWWSDLMSVETDLTQFRRAPQNAPQQVPAEQSGVAEADPAAIPQGIPGVPGAGT